MLKLMNIILLLTFKTYEGSYVRDFAQDFSDENKYNMQINKKYNYLLPIKPFVKTPIEDYSENAFPKVEYHTSAIGNSKQLGIQDKDFLLAKKVENFYKTDPESNKLNKYVELEGPTGIVSKRKESSPVNNDFLDARETMTRNKDLSDGNYGILGAPEDSYLFESLQPNERSTSEKIFYNWNWKALTGVVVIAIMLTAVATYSCFSLIKSITHKKPKKSEFKVDRWLAGSNRSSI